MVPRAGAAATGELIYEIAKACDWAVSSEAARAWWGNFLVQKANESGLELDALARREASANARRVSPC